MKKEILYNYLGTNGSLLTPIHLEGIYSVKKYRLTADVHKKLTKDNVNFYKTIVVHELEINSWYEVDE